MAQQSTLEFLVAAQVTGQEQIARLINDTDKLNKTTKGLQSAFAQMGGAARSLSEVQKNAAAIDAARAEKIARLSQEFYNNALAIDRNAKSARDSASVFEEAFQAQEMAAQAQRDAAAAADQLRARLDPMIPIQNRFNAEMDRASDLLRMGAISQKEYAQATTLARQNLYSAQQALHSMNAAQSGVIVNGVRYNSMADAQAKALRQQRQGVQQLGMQFNDLATSIATGANPVTAFNQQIGQVGIAMSQMEGKMGAVGQFLIGPWGTALTIATMALGFLAEKFLFVDDSAKKADNSIKSLEQQFNFAAMSAEDLKRVNELLAETNSKMARTSYQAANATAAQANANANAVASTLDLARAELFRMKIQSRRVQQNLDETLDPMQANVAQRFMQNRVNAQEQSIKQLEAALNGFQYASRRAAGEAYSIMAGMDAGAKATERYNSQVNRLQNSLAAGLINESDFRREVDAANAIYRKAQEEIAASNKKDRKSRGLTEAQKEAKKLAEATTRYYANAQGKFVDEYQGYRVMMTKSDQEWADRLSALDDETFRNSLDRAAEMAKGIGYISQAAGEDISNFFQKPYEELQNSFQSIGMAVSDSFKGMLTGAMSWKDGMKSIISAVIDQLWQLYVVQQIVGFVTKALGGLGAPNPAAASTAAANIITVNRNAIANVKPGLNANGTQNWRGGLSWVGERGPELVNLPRGSQVIPAHRAQNMGGGGINISVDARGSSDPAAVRAQVEAGILQAAPAIIAAAEARTVAGLRRPRLGGAIK